MVSCKQCQTPNSLDSTFCKRCGAAIAESDLTEAQAKMEQLIEEGNALFNQGRTDEALAIAEAAVLGNPSSTSGWSLKTLCHERRGEIAEALECADRLVELNPGSDFDKIRRSTLRQKLQTDLHVPAAPDRKLAVLGAASAIVLVLCIGAIVARVGANNTTATKSTGNPPVQTSQPNTQLQNTPQTSPLTGGGTQQPPVTQSGPPANQGFQQPPTTGQTNNEPRSNPNRNLDLPNYGGGTLPGPGELGNTEIVPVNPQIDPSKLGIGGGPAVPITTSKPPASHDQSEPTPMGDGNTKQVNAGDSGEPKDTGTYQITVRGGGSAGKGATSGSEPVGSTGIDAMTRVGNQQFLMSNFAAAAKSYEQAIQSGGDAVTLNRRLGQTYERLGRNSDAVNAYQRCMSAIDGAIASGRGDKERLASTRGVCEQAVKVLQGG